MIRYRLSLCFTAADDAQAERLAGAWAATCAAEYGTTYAGVTPADQDAPAKAAGCPPERLRAALRVLGPEHLHPTATRLLSALADEYDEEGR